MWLTMRSIDMCSGLRCFCVAVIMSCSFLFSSVYFFKETTTTALYAKQKQFPKQGIDLTSPLVHVESYSFIQNQSAKIKNKEGILYDVNRNSTKWKDLVRFNNSLSKPPDFNTNNVKIEAGEAVAEDVSPMDSVKRIFLSETTVNKSSLSVRNISYLEILTGTLEKKIAAATLKKVENYKPTCENDFKVANSCDNNKCLQTELPENLTMRVAQLVTPSQLQMSQDEHEILHDMADNVNGNYDIILLTAASSNHFLESQALLKNLHENVYPYLKNFTLIFYNLGLTEPEKKLMVKYCQCRVIDFPFHKFPTFMTKLKCYSWKPVLIKANLQKANIVFWMDASIRFHNSSSNFHALIQRARDRGVQIGSSSADTTFRTYRSMFHFFGDEPCAYLNRIQVKATFGVYHREYFVDRVILEPWVACALNTLCMCPNINESTDCEVSKRMTTKYYEGNGHIVYGLCHRFDQSAISLILHKLYQGIYRWVMVDTNSVLKIRRKNALVYFPDT